jgi:hypothetical protein
LLGLWVSILLPEASAASSNALFEDAATRTSVLPAVKLMLAVLRVHSSPAASSSGSNISYGSADKQWERVQNALVCATNLAQAITVGPRAGGEVRSKPLVQQVLTAPELQQLLIAAAAWMAGLLHQQQQGRAAVDAAAVVRCLSNSAAAATYAIDTSSRHSSSSKRSSSSSKRSSSSSSSSIKVLPHHARVLELLEMSVLIADPSCPNSPASTQSAREFCDIMLQDDIIVTAVFKAAGFCLDHCNIKRFESASSSSWCSTLPQLPPALLCMLAEVVQLGPGPEVCAAVLSGLTPTLVMDMNVWQDSAGAAAVSDVAVHVGPAVLHLVQQQEQLKEDDIKHCQYALWYWGTALMSAVGAGGYLFVVSYESSCLVSMTAVCARRYDKASCT